MPEKEKTSQKRQLLKRHTFIQASDMVFWNLTADLMPSSVSVTLSPARDLEASLFKETTF